jgi:hypothetical protein
LYRSSKSPDFEGSALPSYCSFRIPPGAGEESHGHNEKQESGNRNQDGKEKGKSKKAKV